MQIDFLDVLTEAVLDRLDISILSADKYLTSQKKLIDFFNTECTIEAKTDGVKVTALKIADDGKLSDWIIAYKGHILYKSEFEYQPDTKARIESIGTSQFKILLNHFEKIGKNNIPVGTELQLEFLMRKPTLSSHYKRPHGIVLIGYSKSSYTESYGILKTRNNGMKTEKRFIYAKELRLNVPNLIFKGTMNSELNFKRGIVSDELKTIFEQNKNSLTWNNLENLYKQVKAMLLEIPSVFGGKEEGVVIKFTNGPILKLQQDYQLDQVKRLEIKQQYREDSAELESQYWENVKKSALELVSGIQINSRKLPDLLDELARDLKRYRLDYSHSKKTPAQIKDDIQLNAKTLLIKGMKGNAGCLILGKFRILTNGHVKLIKKAIKDYDRVALCMVTSKDTLNTQKLRKDMIKRVFGDTIEFIESNNGNIIRILDKVPFNVNVVYTGTDRVSDYQKQLSRTIGVTVKEMKRTSDDISATKVIDNIINKEYFEQNTPKELHDLYPKLLKEYGNIPQLADVQEETTSGDIATVDTKLNLVSRKKKVLDFNTL